MPSLPLRKPPEGGYARAGGCDAASRDLRLLSHPSELRRARCHVDEAAAEFGLGPTDRYQLVFAVNEAVTNAIRYGKPDRDGTIGLRIAVTGDTLICSVNDRGRGPVRASTAHADPLAEGGRGFTYMALLADEIELLREPDGTTVRLHKRRPDGPVEADV